MLKEITIAKDPLDPASWQKYEVEDVCAFLVTQFDRFPDNAHIYHNEVAQVTEVTPRSSEDIDKLQKLEGRFFVVVYAGAGGAILPYIFAILLTAASYFLAPSPTAPPQAALRNSQSPSPNNELSDRQNRARINGRIPDIFGTVQSTPDLIAAPYKIIENNREVEYSYMCIGRGAYAISQLPSGDYIVKDGDTLISKIAGSSVAIYAPYSSPNTGDTPQLLIGSAITHAVLNTKRCNSVNGQVLRPPNSATFTGPLRFRYPNIIETNSGSANLSGSFVEGDIVTLSGAVLAASAVVAEELDVVVTAFEAPAVWLHEHSFTVPNPLAGWIIGQEITITDLSATINDAGYLQTQDLSGTYFIADIIENILDVGFGGPGNVHLSTSYVLDDPQLVNANWDAIPTDQYAFKKRFELSSTNGALAFDLDGVYTIVSVTADRITLSNPAAVTTDWNNLAPFLYSPFLTVTLTTTNSVKWYGPFIIDVADMDRIFSNFVAQNGLYKDDGTDQLPADVTVQLEVTQVDSSYALTGVPALFTLTLLGSFDLKETIQKTLTAVLPFTGRCSIRASRITPSDTAFTGTVVDEVRWRDVYSVAPVAKTDFGNVTTVHAVTFATASALAVKERRLSMLVTRKVPQRITGSTFTDELIASDDVADILTAVCRDQYIGKRLLAELDIDSFYDTADAVETYFGNEKARKFCYTFDSDNISFEETVLAIAGAMFSIPYRRGNVIKLSFDKATENSTLLFNHRNKLPGTEKRSLSFGFNGDFDGIEYTYANPDDDSLISIFLPESFPSTNPKKIESIGIRNHLQAYFHAWREWNKLRYQNMTTDFEATQEADVAVINDRVLVSDGTRPNIQDGEVIGVATLELTLSQNVDLTVYGSYVIFLQLSDGSVESIDITAGSADNKVVLGGAPTLPLVTDPGMFARTTYLIVGDSEPQQTAFLIAERTPQGNKTSNVRAINYDARYYQNDLDFINGIVTDDAFGPDGAFTPGVGTGFPSTSPGIRKVTGADYIALASMGHASEYTFTGWARFPEFGGRVFTISASAVSDTHYLAIQGNGDGLDFDIGSTGGPFVDLPVVDQWFFWAITFKRVSSNLVATLKWAYSSDSNFTASRTLSRTYVSGIGADDLDIIDTQLCRSLISGTDSTPQDFAQTRQWTAALTDAELLTEKASASAARTANLFSDNPMNGIADLSDASGNGNVITIVSTVSNFADTDGPVNG